MVKKRKSRKQLLKKPDEFITLTGRAIAFAGRYQKQISYALCAVMASVLIFFGYRFFAQRAEVKAFSMLQQTQSEYQALKDATSAPEAYSKVSEAFEEILKKYGGNAGGKLARIIYANISYDAGHYDKAIGLYKQSLNHFQDDEVVYNLIVNSLGYAYQQMGDAQTAAVYFERAAATTDSFVREEALFNLGWVYQKLEKAAKSRQALQKFVDEYPNSIYFDLVQEELIARGIDVSS